ncbi:probable glycosyltransferase At5g03795 [Euphorbia lathyris]|uniref:probable glycosyltransferase At5g03795 n=1 Tax=Euphorbia lathyris TaxID=212925 RepID=UPI003313C869
MDQGFRFRCQAHVRRLLYLMLATIALLIAFQYFEFPLTKILSLFSVGNARNFFPTQLSSPSSQILSNRSISTFSNEFHHTMNSGEASISEKNAQTNDSKEMEQNTKRNHVSESSEASIHTFGVISNKSSSGSEVKRAMAPVISFTNVTEKIAMAMAPDMSLANNTEDFARALSPVISFTNITEVLASILEKNKSSGTFRVSATRKKSWKPPLRVISLTQMNDLLQKSRASSYSVRPNKLLEVDHQMMLARSQIENAPGIENDTILYAPLYRNVSMFRRSYELMENILKVYIYQDGEKPIFHQPILEGIYASEGWFMKHMEGNKIFVTEDASKAHLFYIPFSSRLLELTLYVRHSHSRNNLIEYMKNYTDMITSKYLFWNRTSGADHFVAACHDWAPAETRGRMLNCMRALCNADIEVGFNIGKDVSLPETYVRSAENPLKNLEGNPASKRRNLAFFAGNIHGYVRPILLEYWENKDPAMKIFGPLPHVKGNKNYIEYMKSSKYCICPKGHEVNSPRIVEALFYECVPVIISDNYIPPLFEVLEWESFAVFVLEKDIPHLKSILLSISPERYVEMHKRVKKVQQHFLWHSKPVKYDLFHMILHSIWYNRVFQM